MTYTTPHIFAIVRDAYRGPCLQILTTDPITRYTEHRRWPSPGQDSSQETYEVLNYRNADGLREFPLQQASRNSLDRRIRTLHYLNRETQEVQHVKYWYLPYYFRYRGTVIPLLEFQYRSWIPSDYTPVPISQNLGDITSVMERIQQERLQEIRLAEDSQRSPYQNPPWFNGYDDHDDRPSTPPYHFIGAGARSRRSSTPPPPPVPELRIVHVEVPVERVVERVVVERRALSLPKDVGDLLLAKARGGTDSCPIAATPFSECEKLCVSSCFHIFEKESLARWQESHTTCPVCRCKIENVVSE